MLGTIIKWTAISAAAAFVGFQSAAFALKAAGDERAVRNGAWLTFVEADTNSRNPYVWFAKAAGQVSLPRSEFIFYVARSDTTGEPLRGRCSYVVEGKLPKAAHWSLMAYAENGDAMGTPGRNLVSATSFPDASQNGLTVRIGPSGQVDLKSSRSGEFQLLLRLTRPPAELVADPAAEPLPSITREFCSNG